MEMDNFIALVFDDVIAVTDSANHRIQFFDLCGNFLCKLGRRGSNDGEFCFPRGLAVDKINVIESI